MRVLQVTQQIRYCPLLKANILLKGMENTALQAEKLPLLPRGSRHLHHGAVQGQCIGFGGQVSGNKATIAIELGQFSSLIELFSDGRRLLAAKGVEPGTSLDNGISQLSVASNDKLVNSTLWKAMRFELCQPSI